MKAPNIQNAISFEGFKVINCSFKASTDVDAPALEKLKIGFGFGTGFYETKTDAFIVTFSISLKLPDVEKLSIDIEAQSLFSTQRPVDDEFKKSDFANINAPAIAFPFLRSFIQTLCVNAGIPPIVLPSFNFAQAVENSRKERNS